MLLLIRTLGDHSHNNHFTGDHASEPPAMVGAENFAKYGYWNLKFMPVLMVTHHLWGVEGMYYTHYPAMGYWVYSIPSVIVGRAVEGPARVLAATISLIGILTLMLGALHVLKLLNTQENEYYLRSLFLIFVGLGPGILCFSDTLCENSLSNVWFFLSFTWSIGYLFLNYRLRWGIILMALHIWTSFEWIIPVFVAFSICIYLVNGVNYKKLFQFWILGFCTPIILRLLHNTWALGSFTAMINDFLEIAKVRSGGVAVEHEYYAYGAAKHFFKATGSLLWFTGIPALAVIGLGFQRFYSKLKENRKLAVILGTWAVGSISWQFFMRQHGMVHGFTYVHFGNYFLLMAFIIMVSNFELKRPILMFLCFLQIVQGAMVVRTEVIQPFLQRTSTSLIARMCQGDRNQRIGPIVEVGGSFGKTLVKNLESFPLKEDCEKTSRWASEIFKILISLEKATYWY